ncbi:MAG: mechanosensitive ion channel family protein [Candidatus Cloacimonetes bacterium]|nr:mechanosensitive ion channel family protein [Candidatus Cloacimonadota bacterium]MBL7085570.1 mechanosensitive ion channel family protein [Candidatus Cloacimonadota bacterium]
MTAFFTSVKPIIIPISIVIGCILVGIILQKIIFVSLLKIAKGTSWKGDDIIIHSIKGMLILWSFIIGIYIALPFISLSSEVIKILNKIILTLIIFSVTLVIAKMAAGFAQQYGEKAGGTLASTSIFRHITTAVILVIGILIILQGLGIAITPILTALGVGGLAVALALKDTLSNLFSGFQIIAAGQIKKGDYIKLSSGEAGYVTDINWRNTTIKAFGNNIIVIPNSKIASLIVTNYNLPQKNTSVPIEVGVSYDSDLEFVESVTLDVAREVMKELKDLSAKTNPIIRYRSFGESSINFAIILYVSEYVNKFLLRHEFIKRLHKRYNEEGIEIPFPLRTVIMKQPKE